jgi:outer membrane protein
MKNKLQIVWIGTFFFSCLFGTAQKKWTLQECVDYALKNNISILNSDLDTQLAEVSKKDAIGAFLPNINGNASHSWNIGLNQNITTGLLQNQTTQFTSAGITANIPIYNGLQRINRLRRSRMNIVASQYQLTKMKDDVSLNVANSFLQILFNKENIKVQKELLANDELQFNRTNEQVKAGVVAKGDLLDITATIATDRQNLVNAENALFLSKLSLAQILQIESYKDFDIIDAEYETSASQTMLKSPETIIEKAKTERVELKIAKANLEIAQKDITIAKSAYQPSLNGFYSFSTRASNSERFAGVIPNTDNPTTVIGQVEGTGQNVVQPNFSPILSGPNALFNQFSDNKGNIFGLQLNIPILNGFSVRNDVERSKIALERSKISFKQTETDLERNVYTAITDAKGAINAYEQAVIVAAARKQSYEFAKEKYDVGLMNSFDLNQSQLLFANSQSEVLRTKYDSIFKVKVVEFYFGIPITAN